MTLTPEELGLLAQMRDLNPSFNIPSYDEELTPAQKIADRLTCMVGSWRFVIIQSIMLAIWVVLNVVAYMQHWDPYPFILLNLALSFQAAYTAPIIMMSQNRQAAIDRQKLEYYYQVNVKEELEIELLHHKLDLIMRKLDIHEQS